MLSAGLLLSSGCGGDDSGSDDTPPTGSSDAGREPSGDVSVDASLAPKPDAGNTVVDAGLGGLDAGREDTVTLDAAVSTDTSAAAKRGAALADKNVCTSCHQDDYAGAGFYPNITPDKETGIGSWSDQEISDAISKGMDDEGEKLCAVMQRYKFSASELSDMVAFLRSLKAESNEISAICPGHGN